MYLRIEQNEVRQDRGALQEMDIDLSLNFFNTFPLAIKRTCFGERKSNFRQNLGKLNYKFLERLPGIFFV